jgi:UDP-N-acetylglucosamine:LPS N-acetylglucosamine transferase
LTTLDLVYFNAGGGHRAAAEALQAALATTHPQWQVRCVDLFRVLDPAGQFQRLTGFAPEAYYNRRLATGFTLGLAQELKLLQAMIRWGHAPMAARLRRHWQVTAPDAVVSLVPNFNRAIAEGLAAARPGAPFVTVMTDLADHPPHFWIEPCHTQHLVCGSDRAVAQALAHGLPAARVHRVSGMLLRPAFYAPPGADPERDRAAARRAVGLDPDSPVGVVMFGGHGAAAMKRITAALPDRPLILLCGHNRPLAEALRAQPAAAPRVVVGFTPDVAHWLRLADYFIGKPGPGSLSEALHCGLPVVVTRNAWTMPQERFNTDWVRAQDLGVVLPGFAAVRDGVARLLTRLPALRTNVGRLDNRALFELPPLLARLVGDGRTRSPGDAPEPAAAAAPRPVAPA